MNTSRRHLVVAALLAWLAVLTPLEARAQDEGDTTATAAPAAAAPPRTRQSWIADRRSFILGDVLTVMVDEFTLASANLGNTSTNNRRTTRDAGVSARLPASTTAGSLGFNTTDNNEQNQRGETLRQNRFQSEMTVRVVEVLAGGILRVEGRKVLNIDKNKQEVVMSGFVRPQDVGPFNQVDSWRVGELRLDYAHDGAMGKPRQGIVGRIFGWMWP